MPCTTRRMPGGRRDRGGLLRKGEVQVLVVSVKASIQEQLPVASSIAVIVVTTWTTLLGKFNYNAVGRGDNDQHCSTDNIWKPTWCP